MAKVAMIRVEAKAVVQCCWSVPGLRSAFQTWSTRIFLAF